MTGRFLFFSEKNLPFGASISCARFQLFSDCLKHIMEHALSGRYVITNYLDDFLFMGETEEICNLLVRQFLALCEFLGCSVAPEKTEWGAVKMIFLGIMLNGDTCTLSVPMDKANKALELLNWAIDSKKVTVKFIQRLTGTLNFLNKAIVPGRAFTRGMYSKLSVEDSQGRKLKQHHHVKLNNSFIQDCLVWKSFLGADNLNNRIFRPFVDVELYQDSQTLEFYTDTSLNEGLGCGGTFMNEYFVAQWPEGFVYNCRPSIQFLELFALTAGVLIWGDKMVNCRVAIFCDNESVKSMVNSFTSSCSQCRKLLRILAFEGLKYNRRLFVRHVRTEINTLADALSRLNFRKFWKHAPSTMNKAAKLIPDSIWPINKIWDSNM